MSPMSSIAFETAETAPAPIPRPAPQCPACRSSRAQCVGRVRAADPRLAEPFELLRCAACDLTYLTPRPDPDAIDALYDGAFYYPAAGPGGALARAVLAAIQSSRRRRIERLVPRGRLLDIGSGDGRFVEHMARHGWEATGIDPSPAAFAIVRRHAHGRFACGSLEAFDFGRGSLDAITMWQVLEHVGEPMPLLLRCRHMLRPGGVLVASVPNLEGLSARLTGERWWGLDVPRHLAHYTPATLRRTLERAGMHVIEIRHRSFQYDPYALFHSTLDWAFTRRHFLSNLAKQQVPADTSAAEWTWNLGALALLAPLLAPASLVATTAAACTGHGGFIEVHARRE